MKNFKLSQSCAEEVQLAYLASLEDECGTIETDVAADLRYEVNSVADIIEDILYDNICAEEIPLTQQKQLCGLASVRFTLRHLSRIFPASSKH